MHLEEVLRLFEREDGLAIGIGNSRTLCVRLRAKIDGRESEECGLAA
jgi:hypothetical protein